MGKHSMFMNQKAYAEEGKHAHCDVWVQHNIPEHLCWVCDRQRQTDAKVQMELQGTYRSENHLAEENSQSLFSKVNTKSHSSRHRATDLTIETGVGQKTHEGAHMSVVN